MHVNRLRVCGGRFIEGIDVSEYNEGWYEVCTHNSD